MHTGTNTLYVEICEKPIAIVLTLGSKLIKHLKVVI